MDVVGIMYFFCFFIYMEELEYEMLCLIGMSVMFKEEGIYISWL